MGIKVSTRRLLPALNLDKTTRCLLCGQRHAPGQY